MRLIAHGDITQGVDGDITANELGVRQEEIAGNYVATAEIGAANGFYDIILWEDNLVDELAAKMNRCPRKCIGFKTPQEIFFQQYKNDCRTWS